MKDDDEDDVCPGLNFIVLKLQICGSARLRVPCEKKKQQRNPSNCSSKKNERRKK